MYLVVAQKRGRGFGIVAIVIASVAPFVSVVLFAVFGLAFGHHVYQ
jgi:hypothetical protein